MKPVRLVLVAVTALTLQEAVLDGIRVRGAHPDVMVLFVIACGFVAGAERGAVAGFVVGLLADAVLPTPFGLSALVFTLVGYGVGSLRSSGLTSAWWVPPSVALVASAVAELAFGGIGSLLDQPLAGHVHLALVVVVVAAVNGALAVPAIRVTAWAYGHPAPPSPVDRSGTPAAATVRTKTTTLRTRSGGYGRHTARERTGA